LKKVCNGRQRFEKRVARFPLIGGRLQSRLFLDAALAQVAVACSESSRTVL
jgi:hypothetical protein